MVPATEIVLPASGVSRRLLKIHIDADTAFTPATMALRPSADHDFAPGAANRPAPFPDRSYGLNAVGHVIDRTV